MTSYFPFVFIILGKKAAKLTVQGEKNIGRFGKSQTY